MAKHKTKLNKYEQIRDHSIVQKLILELEQVKKMQLELKTQIQESTRISINNQVNHRQEVNSTVEKKDSKPKNRFKL
jgi:hypothetical protein